MAVERRAMIRAVRSSAPGLRCAMASVALFAAAVVGCGDGSGGAGGSGSASSADGQKPKAPEGQPGPPAKDALGEQGAKSDGPSAADGDGKPAPKYAEVTVKPNAGLPTTEAVIAGKKFKLEVAATPESRAVGLMAREKIDPDGGMVFVFPPTQFQVQSFWMGDCLTDIDILYLDSAGRILTMHEMKVDRRLEGESDAAYNQRLKKYSSRFRSGLAVELAPGSIKKLGLKEGDLVRLDLNALKKMAR